MIARAILPLVKSYLDQYPVVALLGPRQSGKTTLAKTLNGYYFDLEDEQDRLKLDIEWEKIIASDKLTIFDEAQTFPSLFPRLRSAIDKERKKNGRFILLGSVAPALMIHVSESLAGRVALCELSPLLASEMPEKKWPNLWKMGGFPDGGVLRSESFPYWQKNYLDLLAQRDLPNWGLSSKPQQTQRLFAMIAALNGQTWNASRIGKSLGLSYHTINTYLDFLENTYLIRRLPAYSANLKKRLIKNPKIYWRDSGLLHNLLQIDSNDDLTNFPWVGASWEGWIIEQIISTLKVTNKIFQAWHLRTQEGYEIDLVLEFGKNRWAIEIKLISHISNNDFDRLNKVAKIIKADRTILLTRASRTIGDDKMLATNLHGLLEIFKQI